MLYFWKVILKLPTFWPLFLTKLSQKHKIIFLNKMKLGTNPKKLFLHPKSNFTICEKKSTTIMTIFKKLWLSYDLSNFPLFGRFAQCWLNILYCAVLIAPWTEFLHSVSRRLAAWLIDCPLMRRSFSPALHPSL